MKLPNGYGSVYRLSGNRRRPWIAVVTTGWCDDTGRQLRYTVGYYKTKTDALSALADYNKNPIGETLDKTLGEVYEEWSKKHYSGDIAKSTINGYKAAWNRMSRLSKYEMRQIYKQPLQDIITEMSKAGLSRSTMENFKTLAVMLWREAMANRIVDRNYGEMLDLPKVVLVERPTFTDFEIKRIDEAAQAGDVWAGTVMMLLYTGMRVGEMVRLTRFNVDTKHWVITGGIKTDAGKDRPVPVHPKIRSYVKYWLDTNGPRLVHRNGEPISVAYYRKSIFYPLLERLEIERSPERNLTPHCTRHTFGTMLNRAGAKTTAIQKLMGHADYATTANVYTHPDFVELKEAIELL